MADNEYYVETVKLTKTFRDFWLRERVTAVSDLDLRVGAGEVFGLLGPNGSGKSTTLKIILGLLFPTRGRVAVFGRRPTDVRSKARVGFLPEESYLYPFLDARETLDYYGRLFHQPRRQRVRRIDMLLEMVGLKRVAYRRVGEYSKGMQRRVGLAQALINDPDLLILDEPTSGMDPIGSRDFKDLIVMLTKRGKTVLLASHLLADVEEVCDRVCVLYGGQQRALGDIDELLARQDRTQIVTSRLDEATLARLRALLADSGRDIHVSTPHDKLESLFLRIVEEAQAKRLATGGVEAGGQVAEFLRTGEDRPDTGRAVIEQLVAVTEPVSPTPVDTAEPAEPPAPAPARDVLEGLAVSQAAEQAPPPAAEPPAAGETQRPHADRAVIDDLLTNDSDGKEA
jgi:ABC-2 type transport system ATP-binding protein